MHSFAYSSSRCHAKADKALCSTHASVLLQKANDNNPTVAANVLMCLGELVCVGAEDAMPHDVPDLMQVIIDILSSGSLIHH